MLTSQQSARILRSDSSKLGTNFSASLQSFSLMDRRLDASPGQQFIRCEIKRFSATGLSSAFTFLKPLEINRGSAWHDGCQ